VGEFYERTVNVKLPAQVTGQWHITVWTDAHDVVTEDTLDVNINPDDPHELDSNNYKSRAITVLLTPPPDLVVTSVVPDATGHGGEPFTVTWTVPTKARPATQETAWLDTVYLANAPTLSAATQTLRLGQVQRTRPSGPDENYTATPHFDLDAGGSRAVRDRGDRRRRVGRAVQAQQRELGRYERDQRSGRLRGDGGRHGRTRTSPASGQRRLVDGRATTARRSGPARGTGPTGSGFLPIRTFIQSRAIGWEGHVQPRAAVGTGESYTQTAEFTLPPGSAGNYYIYVGRTLAAAPTSSTRGTKSAAPTTRRMPSRCRATTGAASRSRSRIANPT
jgi:large repetitive protein